MAASDSQAFLQDVPVLLRDARGLYLLVLTIGACGRCQTIRACFISRNGRSACCDCDTKAGER